MMIRYYVEVKIMLDKQVADMLDEYYIVTLDQTD